MAHIVDFRKPESIEEISLFLGLDVETLETAIAHSASPDLKPCVYFRHRLPKKRGPHGSYRVVWEVVDNNIRDAHRAFARRFGDFAHDVDPGFPHSSSFGYMRGLSIKENAAKHAGHRLLFRCDLRDFFPSISKTRLIARLMRMDIPASTATTLAFFATIENQLALGLNASPLLANLVCSDLDTKLSAIADAIKCTYTRYADDIAFSGDQLPNIVDVRTTIESEGFEISPNKSRTTKIGQAHFVTGLSISDRSGPRVPRRFKRKLRQEIYYCKKFGVRDHLLKTSDRTLQRGINRIDGSVRFVGAIEPKLGDRMRAAWNAGLASENLRTSYAPIETRPGADTALLFDEAEFVLNGQPHLGLACVVTDNISGIRLLTEAILREYLVDPFATGRKEKLEKYGLHFTDAPDALRAKYVNIIHFMPFRAYVAFAKIADSGDYGALYVTLLSSILPRRFKGLDRGNVSMYFETNKRISQAAIAQVVNSIYRELEENNDRRPLVAPQVAIVSKLQEPALSLPDSLLWIFSRYFGADVELQRSYHLWFERLRDKYRHVVDVDSGRTFSRRHPIEGRGGNSLNLPKPQT